MKFGVKTYGDKNFADYFKDKADFLEIMAIPENDYSFLENYPIPIIIHAMHAVFGVNFADENCSEKNIVAINFAKELADKFGSKKIIVHPGNFFNNKCSMEKSCEIFKKLDERFVIENCRHNSVGKLPEEMKDFLSKTKKKMCLDFNHAFLEAKSLEKSPEETIKKFIKLCPAHFHICGCNLNDADDNHLSFEDAEYDYSEFLREIPLDSEITLETSNEIEKVESDLRHIREIVKNL